MFPAEVPSFPEDPQGPLLHLPLLEEVHRVKETHTRAQWSSAWAVYPQHIAPCLE